MAQLFDVPRGKPQTGRLKASLFGPPTMDTHHARWWKHLVTPMGAPGEGPFPDKTDWNEAVD